jgi:hypothetical protein
MKFFYLFIISNVLTFGFIALLQFAPVPYFFLVLVAMHMGVVLFIFSKRGFKKLGVDVKREYLIQDVLLALYLPILAAKLMAGFGWIVFPSELKTLLVLSLTGISYIVTACNALSLYKKICRA